MGNTGETPSGTTSACAENTSRPNPPTFANRNYLRVRGEYLSNNNICFTSAELPPRARRIRKHRVNGIDDM